MAKGKKSCRACCLYCYNKQDKTCCRRTCASWIKIILYYSLFVLFLLFLFMLILYTINDSNAQRTSPYMMKHALYAGAFPGAALLPTSADKLSEPIIYFGKQKSPQNYINAMQNFLKDQESACKRVQNTGYRNCSFQLDDLGPCAKPDFGFKNGTPCVYLKLNKLLSWVPDEFKTKENIKALPEPLKAVVNVSRACIWVHCQGLSPYDEQHIGKIDYYPEPAFHERYFPFEEGLSINPVVAVHFTKITPGHLLKVKCMQYALNLDKSENANVISYVYIDK